MADEEVEISVVLKIPKGYYQVASGLARIYNHANFDEYVSDVVEDDLEALLGGIEPVEDHIHQRLKGKRSPFVKRINAQFRPINKRLKLMVEEEEREKEAMK
jgi:hypothetical protein